MVTISLGIWVLISPGICETGVWGFLPNPLVTLPFSAPVPPPSANPRKLWVCRYDGEGSDLEISRDVDPGSTYLGNPQVTKRS